MNNMQHSLKRFLLITILVAIFFIFNSTKAFATATVTVATGGSAISADTTGGTYTTLTGPVITENLVSEINTGTIILNVASGFIFDVGGVAPTVLVTRTAGTGANTKNINNVASGTSVAITSRTTTQITFTVTSVTSGGVKNSVTWQNIRVRPSAGTPLASGNIVKTGTSAIAGITNSVTNLGTLTEIVGAASKLVFSTQPVGGTYGSSLATQPIVKSQDQFSNNSATGLGVSKNVTLTLSSGTGSLSGTTVLDIGTGSGNGTVTFSGLSITSAGAGKALTAATTGLTSAVSSSFTITKAVPTLSVTNSPATYNGSPRTATVSGSVAGTASNIKYNGSATTPTNAGTYAITADFAPTDSTNYNSLTGASAGSFVISVASQIITFGALSDKTLGNPDFTVSATTSSNLTVSFASQTASVCTVSVATVHLVTIGTCAIRASQAGNSNYNAALNVDQSFTVNQANNPVPTATSISPNTLDAGGTGFTLTVNGTNFISSSVVKWNGADKVTTFVSNIKLTAVITASDIATSGAVNVTVFNPTPGGGTSSAQTFTITVPATKFVIINPTDNVVGHTVTVTVQAQDVNNNVITAYNNNVTLVTSGSAAGAGLVNIVNGVGTLDITDQTAETVNLSLSDTQSTGLNVSSAQDVIFATGPLFQFTINNPGDTIAGARVAYVVTRKDQFGNLITGGVSPVHLYTSSTSGLGFFYDATISGNIITSVVIADGSSTANFWYGEGRVGSFSVTVSDNSSAPDGATGVADASDSIAITAGPTSILFLNDPGNMTAGDRLGYTITRRDSFNNLAINGNETFFLYSNSDSANKGFYNAPSSGNIITSIVISNNSSSASFWYFDDKEGTWTITASDNATTPDGATGITDATDTVAVSAIPIVPTRIIILNPTDSTVGNVTAVTIKVVDDIGALDTSFSNSVTLNTSGSAIGGGIITITNGVGTANLNDNTSETVSLSLSDSGGTALDVSSTQDVVFATGPTAQFTLNDPGNNTAGNRAGYTVTRKDQFGNLVTNGIDTVYFYTNSTGSRGKFFDGVIGGNVIVSTNITAGQSSVNFWYEEGTAGSWTTTVSDNNTAPDGATGVADVNDAIVITPANAHDFFLNDPGNMTASTRLGYTVTRKDVFGNLVTSGSQVVNLSSSSPSANKAFFDVATGGTALTSVTISDGANSKNFWYFDDTAGTYNITTGANSINNAVDSVVVSNVPIVATKFVISVVSSTLTGSTVTVTINAEDDNGNIDTTFAGDITLKATGAVTGEGVVHVVNGVGTKDITDATSQTVTLSLQDTDHTGLNVDSTSVIIFSEVVVPSSPSIGGGSTEISPTFSIKFSGKVAPGSLINVLGVPSGGNASQAVILDQQVSGGNGTFNLGLDNPDTKSSIYIVSLTDKNHVLGQFKIFSKVPDVATLSNIVFAPTISLLRSLVRKADFLSLSGSANVGTSIEAQFDGTTKAKETATVSSDGTYKLLLSTAGLSLGRHTVRVRSVGGIKPSDYSLSSSYVVSALFNPEVDLNVDGVVDARDINIFNSDWASSDPAVRNNIDFNHDGKVDIQDFSIFTQALKH